MFMTDSLGPRRRSIRLQGYDYSRPGVYFVTIVTQGRLCLFGEVVDGQMVLNDAGRIVVDAWEWLGVRHGYVDLDAYVVMPNHLHGIIVITDRGWGCSEMAPSARRKSLGRLVGAFKTVSTNRVNAARGRPGDRLWQRNYYEHVVRNDAALERIRDYITGNPNGWDTDEENPKVG